MVNNKSHHAWKSQQQQRQQLDIDSPFKSLYMSITLVLMMQNFNAPISSI